MRWEGGQATEKVTAHGGIFILQPWQPVGERVFQRPGEAVEQPPCIPDQAPTMCDELCEGAQGGAGTLLLCALAGYAMDRRYEQPGTGGGNYFAFDAQSWIVRHGWRSIDTL